MDSGDLMIPATPACSVVTKNVALLMDPFNFIR